MAFEKIKLEANEISKDIEYLRDLKYTGIFGRKIPDKPFYPEYYYKDEENNAFMLDIGITNPNFETENHQFYIFVLCIDGKPVGICAERFSLGDYYENTIEETWKIKRIVYPDGWKKERYPNFNQLVINAFETISLYQFDKPESVKKVDVIFDDTIENLF